MRLLVAATVCATALLLGACGGSSSPASDSASPSGAPVSGGHARIILINDVRTLDPVVLGNAFTVGALVGNALYGTLLRADETGVVRSSMAESFTTTDGGATFTLKLRPGLVFSDGTPLNAEAVRFNWDRAKDPTTGSTARAEASVITSSAVVDATTLSVSLASPSPRYAESILTSTLNWIASPAALRQGREAFDARPIGAGPFTLRSWTRNSTLELTRNSRYWDQPRPYLASLTLRAVPDATQRLNTVVTGGADLAIESSPANLGKATDAGLATAVMPLSGGTLIALNSRRPPFDDIRARRALALALDMDDLNLAVYNGAAEPATTLFTKSSPFYSDTPLRRTDRPAAQRLFDELAAAGKPLTFTYTNVPTSENRLTAENVQAQLSRFRNVKVEIRTIQVAELAALRTTHDFDAATSTAIFIDPEPRLATVFAGNSLANLSGVADPELDRALRTGGSASSEADRRAAYGTVQKRLADLVPAVFLMRTTPGVVANARVSGFEQYGLGSLLPDQLWMDD
ncbi:ABC transporter substrate-binding protein [Parafrankia elaeagni]|uniref:ABC transporter substrate-binding protein n=1 Tax=Parafrankia elaeagni TaxID=222534 RepID=UPI00036010FD